MLLQSLHFFLLHNSILDVINLGVKTSCR